MFRFDFERDRLELGSNRLLFIVTLRARCNGDNDAADAIGDDFRDRFVLK